MERVILHSDINCCYAAIEHLYRPECNGKPLAVGGDPQARHGIILTADYLCRQYGVKTGMTLWEARKLCPGIQIVPARMDLYKRFSSMAHEIYSEYTNLIEPYGLDESWLDVTDSVGVKGTGEDIANEISQRMKSELGITCSIGVSWNKVFAKLGSDYKKPDGVTVFSRDKMDIIRSLPAGDLLFVGRSTKKKLKTLGITTIGHIADTPDRILMSHLGKNGMLLKKFACGYDLSPVMEDHTYSEIKSVGNSTTTPRDLVSEDDIKIVLYTLAESVSSRMRDNGFKGNIVEIWVRDNQMSSFVRQQHIQKYTDISGEIAGAAMELFRANYTWDYPVRSVGVRVTGLTAAEEPEQLTLFDHVQEREKKQEMDIVVENLRRRFGTNIIKRGIIYKDTKLVGHDIKEQGFNHKNAN